MMQAAGDVDARSRGGMRAKLEAARRASAGGTEVVIASGHEPNVISRIAGGERLGTLIPADTTIRDSRERWLLAGLHNGEGLDLDRGRGDRVDQAGTQPAARRDHQCARSV